MLWENWRARVVTFAASFFLVWHTLAMLVAPAPGSAVKQSLVNIMQPYLTMLGFSETWGFYTPVIGAGQRLRHVVETPGGEECTFTEAEELFSWFNPRYWWVSAWHNTIINSPERYA